MLYYNFNNYEGFKERFGIVPHGNGVKSRKNKILLAWYKQPALLRKARETGDYSDLNIPSMVSLWNALSEKVGDASYKLYRTDRRNIAYFGLLGMTLVSKSCELDELQGVCEDGDIHLIRYVDKENGRVSKMKAGRFFNKCLEDIGIEWPEPVRLWMCEEFSRRWETYASSSQVSKTGALELHVDDDFASIYSSDECDGNFGSCMVDDDQWSFYRDAVNAQAAYLRNKDGYIVARCIVFNEVHDDDTGEVVRLAERQYATDGDEVLKRLLVDALIKGKYIDGYKKVGVSCHDNRAYVSNSGEDWSGRHFSIVCNLENDDILSYQDSFVFYDPNKNMAYNYHNSSNDEAFECLNDTNTYFCIGWDSWNERYTNESLYEVWSQGAMYETDYYTREDDFIEIGGTYYHRDECSRCPRCDEWYHDGDGVYSDLLDRYFCCQSCCDEAEDDYRRENMTYSEYDDEYFEDADDVTEWKRWRASRCNGGCYYTETISLESLSKLIDKDEVVYCNGMYYALRYVREWNPLTWRYDKVYND